MRCANDVWVDLLTKVYSSQSTVSPRGLQTKELLGSQTRIDMARPVVTYSARKLGRRFAVAEAAWIIGGRNDLASILPYSKDIAKFSDDGRFFSGAYGVKVVDQLRYVCDSLRQDQDTRQAVINIWRENPRPSADVPCTLSLQFLIRNKRLQCCATMRSSDVWLGVVYDWLNFSSLSTYILLMLREKGVADLELGELILTAGSQHLYESNFKAVEALFSDTKTQEYAPLDVSEFSSPEDFLNHLNELKDRKDSGHEWLRELLIL